jgi:CheY-like chemotaxis protein
MAIEAIDQSPPQAIILDMLMPESNGSVFLQELQSYADTSSIPIVLYSSINFAAQATALRAYGVRYIFDKAKLDFGELRTALATCVASEKVSHAL